MNTDTSSLLATLNSLRNIPNANTLHFEQLVAFVIFASRLKSDIYLVQPIDYHPDSDTLPILPPVMIKFLAKATAIPSRLIHDVWMTLAPVILHGTLGQFLDRGSHGRMDSIYERYGHIQGITYHTLFPPSLFCAVKACRHAKEKSMLRKSEPRSVVLFTMAGAVPAWSIHLYCEQCNINYHHNFSVKDGKRTYYDDIPEVLQIGEHQFAEVKVINMWISMMLLSWASATNCARIYNTAFSTGEKPAWPFKLEVTSDQVFDGFTILSLLEDHKIQNSFLLVPHEGTLRERFTAAVRARNDRFRLSSQPELFHYCKKCTRFYNGFSQKVSVIVIDGVTVGHPCCGHPNCKEPLASNRDRFCPTHQYLERTCAVVGCFAPVADSDITSKTCALPNHRLVEVYHNRRGQARFQLKKRLEEARLAHPNDSVGEESLLAAEIVDDDDREEVFDVLPDGQVVGLEESTKKDEVKLKAKFGRTRTHNEQLFVMPCGVIAARETFYHAEALYSVIEMIKRTYRVPGTMPEHIFFDNNCRIASIVKDDPVFRNVGLTVDVFHFKCKHSKTDQFCQQNCNPHAFPELLGENGKHWYFNSSIAEQTNAWLGGFQSICREMRVDRYNFFLDEMIRRRNLLTIQKLAKQQDMPGTWPYCKV